jgi:hypothetical protein
MTANSSTARSNGVTLDGIREAKSLMEAVRIPVGYVMSPQARAALAANPAAPSHGVEIFPVRLQILVDPRLPVEACEVFHDHESWKQRCEEQNAWDAQNGGIVKPVRCCRCKFVHAKESRAREPKKDGCGDTMVCPRCGAHSYFMVRADGKNAKTSEEWASRINLNGRQ